MRKFTLAIAAALGLIAGTRADAAIKLDFSNNTDTNISILGTGSDATMNFTTNAGSSFHITQQSGGTGDSVGLLGSITGAFKYTEASIVTTVINVPGVGNVQLQTAALSSVGTTELIISDGVKTLTATIAGVNISTFGAGSTINFTGSVNLSNVIYTGDNADLKQLRDEVNASGGITTVSLQFASQTSLSSLLTGTNTASYSGAIATAVPEPGSLAMAFTGITMLSLGCYRQRRRKLA